MLIADAVAFLAHLDTATLILVFWHTVLLEIPRYLVSAIAIAASTLFTRHSRLPVPDTSVSVLLPGHNEAKGLELTIRSLHEQTRPPDRIIVVSDGSTDDMVARATELQRRGLIDVVLAPQVRGGKSSAANLGLRHCDTDIVVIADIDTSFDRDAIEEIIRPMSDSRVGAVCGNLGVRDASSMIADFQAMQYLISISLGRRFSDLFGILLIASGAFAAFRREALEAAGGWDVGPGEDADITLKIRRAGWHVRFAADAWALTQVPGTVTGFVNQRLRWNRSLVRFRIRKFANVFHPGYAQFSLRDFFATFDALVFQLWLAVTFFIYLVWLFFILGDLALVALVGVSLVHVGLGLVSFLIAAGLNPRHTASRLVWLTPVYGLFNSYFLRAVRVVAYIQELGWHSSYKDSYVPRKVREQAERF